MSHLPATTVTPAQAINWQVAAQRRAIIANLGLVTFELVTGGPIGSDVLQMYGNQVLLLSPAQIGLALSLLVFITPAQFLSIPLIYRFGKRRLLQIGYAANIAVLFGFIFLPALSALSVSVGFAAFCLLVLLAEALLLGTWGVAWWPWMREISDQATRGRFLSRMRFAVNVTAALVLFSFSFVVGTRMSAEQFDVLILGLIVWLATAFLTVRGIPEAATVLPTPAVNQGTASRLNTVLQLLLSVRSVAATPSFIRLLILTFSMTFVLVPLFALYATTILHERDQDVARQLTLRHIAEVAPLLLWGLAIDRFGHAGVLKWTSAGLIAVIPAWLFVSPIDPYATFFTLGSLPLVTAIVILTTLMTSGLALALLAASQALTNASSAPVALPTLSMVQSAMVYLLTLLGGAFIGVSSRWTYVFGHIYLDPFKGVILFGVIAAAVCWWTGRSLAVGVEQSD